MSDSDEEITVNSEKKKTNKKDIVYIVSIILFLIISVVLFFRSHSLTGRILDQEILYEGLQSENIELNEMLADYDKKVELAEDYSKEIVFLQNELNKAGEEKKTLQEEIDRANNEVESLKSELALSKDKHGDEEKLHKELDNLRNELVEIKGDNKKLTDIYNDLLSFTDSDYLGSGQYYPDQYVIFTDGEDKTVTITAKSSKKYTTTVSGDNNNISTEWENQFENYQARLKFIPKKEGVTRFTFTNSFNSDSFKIMVVYLKK